MKQVNNYSYLNCGRHLKNEINKESLELFFSEFISYGISSKIDGDIINYLKEYLNK